MLLAHGHLGWGGNLLLGKEILRDVDVFADEVFHKILGDRESSIEKVRIELCLAQVDLADLKRETRGGTR